jgi:hypothetical protein
MAFEISVFLDNKIAHFEKITHLLRQSKINIRSLMLNNIYHGWGVLNLLVDDPEKAYHLLSGAGHSVSMREVIALEMKDQAGGLDELLIKISKAIEKNKMAILIIEVQDILETKKRLEKNKIPFLTDKEVYGK